MEFAEINTKISSAFLKTQNLIEYKCLHFDKNYQKKFHENLEKWSFNTGKSSNYDINKFILLSQKCVYLYE